MHQETTLGEQFTTLAAEGDKHERDSGASSNKAEGGMDIDSLTLDAVPFPQSTHYVMDRLPMMRRCAHKL